MKALRGQLEKQARFGKENAHKWSTVGESLQGLSDFMRRTVHMHTELSKISEDNIALESNAKILNMQIEINKMSSSGNGFFDKNSFEINQNMSPSPISKVIRNVSQEIRRESDRRSALEPIKTYQF